MKYFTIIIFITFMFSGCMNNSSESINESHIWSLNVHSFDEILTYDKDVILIDMRDYFELQNLWKIPWAKHIAYNDADFVTQISQLSKDTKYLIYCNSWNRTKNALAIMKDLWFSNVSDLDGGILAWLWANKQVHMCDESSDFC